MSEIYDKIMGNPEACREEGKRLLRDSSSTIEAKKDGLALLLRASKLKDPEAMFLVGRLMLEENFFRQEANSREDALALLCNAANHGSLQARGYLNRYCDENYIRMVSGKMTAKPDGPLKDFDGKTIHLNRTGVLTPIDAVLEYVDGENVLTFSTNIVFMDAEQEMADPNKFYRAVEEGIKAWEGQYEVFGGQKLKVVVKLTAEDRAFDNVFIIPMTNKMNEQVGNIWDKFATGEKKEQMKSIIDHKRSMAGVGLKKWTVNSRKVIFVQSQTGRFDDYEEIKHVVKHEFGHALGLGDLYKSAVDGLPGVAKDQYRELEGYHIADRFYNLVMCDHHGPVSNNDIEMVVLAFSENCMQHYQPEKIKGKISKALGKGN